jgi:hypothetical protein
LGHNTTTVCTCMHTVDQLSADTCIRT